VSSTPVLTEKRRDFYPVVLAMATWGDRWLSGKQGSPVQLREPLRAWRCSRHALFTAETPLALARERPKLDQPWTQRHTQGATGSKIAG
jgi:hypothetical protein